MNTYQDALEMANRWIIRPDATERMAKLIFENSQLRSELHALRRMANAGIMTEILGHQFESNAQHINDGINRLNREYPPKSSNIKYLTESINELIEYIRYLSPISSRYSDNWATISGNSIQEHLMKFFNKNSNLEIRDFDKFSYYGTTTKILPTISNIIRNGLYWGPQGEKNSSKILIHAVDNTTITITDCGNGFPEDLMHHMFELKFTRSRGGSGIGLYLAKLNMQHIGGDITYCKDTTYGMGGASFTLKFKERQ